MPIDYIYHNGNKYPSWQAEGNAARWIMPLATHIIDTERMVGYDIGFSKIEWMFPNSVGIDYPDTYHAMKLPEDEVDYIFSSHCLEHVKENWADCLDYWLSKLRDGGVLFLYLPHKSQTYWHPTSNRKHVHSFDGSEIADYLRSLGYEPYVTPVDYNNSFAVICYKERVQGEHERLCMAAELAEKIMKADECEKYCKERGIDYIREGNNVIYNEPSCIKYGVPDAHGDVLMHGCFDKSKDYYKGIPMLETHRPLSYLPKLFKTAFHEYGYHTFKLADATDGFIKNSAMVEVELHGETYKTGYLVYPVQWDDDVQSLYHVFDKMIMGVKMILANKS